MNLSPVIATMASARWRTQKRLEAGWAYRSWLRWRAIAESLRHAPARRRPSGSTSLFSTVEVSTETARWTPTRVKVVGWGHGARCQHAGDTARRFPKAA